MNKKVLSFIIILCTILSVFIMSCYHNVDMRENFISNKIKVFNNLKNKQHDNNNDDNNNIRKFSYLLNDTNISNVNNDYKKSKLDEIGEKLADDKKVFFIQDDEVNKGSILKHNSKSPQGKEDNYKQTVESSNQSKKVTEVPNSKSQQNLTLADREKLLTISNKLSAIDSEKVKSYLQSNKPQDVKAVIKLLQERLSDKDYKEIKEVTDKYIAIN